MRATIESSGGMQGLSITLPEVEKQALRLWVNPNKVKKSREELIVEQVMRIRARGMNIQVKDPRFAREELYYDDISHKGASVICAEVPDFDFSNGTCPKGSLESTIFTEMFDLYREHAEEILTRIGDTALFRKEVVTASGYQRTNSYKGLTQFFQIVLFSTDISGAPKKEVEKYFLKGSVIIFTQHFV